MGETVPSSFWGPECGSGLLYALVIALVVVISGAAVASRILYGAYGATYNQDTRRAREAAELGIQRTIAELNRERNRGLLRLNPSSGGFWSAAEAQDAINPCAENAGREDEPNLSLVRSGGASSTIDPASPVTVYIADDGTLTAETSLNPAQTRAANVRYAYQIRPDFQVQPDPYTGADASGVLNQTATLRIQARGFSYNNGRLVSSVTVEKEVEVLPKCCGRSLALFGSDRRPCNEDSGQGAGNGILLLSPGSGQVVIGDVTLTGQKSRISSGEDPTRTINPVVCLSESDSDCPSSVTVGGVDVPVQFVEPNNFPEAPEFPSDLTATAGNFLTNSCSTNSPPAFCYPSGSRIVIDATTTNATSLPAFCKQKVDDPSPGINTIHCNLLEFQITSSVDIKTSSTRYLKFYFTEDGNKVLNSGAHPLVHINTDAPSDPALADRASVRQLQFFGCRRAADGGCEGDSNSLNTQSYAFAGDGSTSGDPAWYYFPIGEVSIAGGGQFNGILWMRKLTGTNNVEIVVPGAGVEAILEDAGMIDTAGTGQDTPFYWDWVARAVRRSTLLPGT